MSNGTRNLTAHQRRVLAVIEDGGTRGVAFDSIIREEAWAGTGRLRSDILTTVYSLQTRGLIEVEVRREERLGAYGVYVHETRIAKKV